jgi:hypothetical protein
VLEPEQNALLCANAIGMPPVLATPVTSKIAVKRRPVVGAIVLAAPRGTPADKSRVSTVSAPEQAGPFTRLRSRHSAKIWILPVPTCKTLPVRSIPEASKTV